jgi:hypothetical protein
VTRHEVGTDTSHHGCVNEEVRQASDTFDRPPTIRQVYALAAALCERLGEPFPERRADASSLIERVRREIGHPAPGLDEAPTRRTARRLGRREDTRADGRRSA